MAKPWAIPHVIVLSETVIPDACSSSRCEVRGVSGQCRLRRDQGLLPPAREIPFVTVGYRWNNNAETYFLIGTAMGEAMKKLCGK